MRTGLGPGGTGQIMLSVESRRCRHRTAELRALTRQARSTPGETCVAQSACEKMVAYVVSAELFHSLPVWIATGTVAVEWLDNSLLADRASVIFDRLWHSMSPETHSD
jgi:hypothetical protein